VRGKGTKLGEHCSKVSQDGMPILKPEGKGTKLGLGLLHFLGFLRSGKVRGAISSLIESSIVLANER
jgi:hypothetical protein